MTCTVIGLWDDVWMLERAERRVWRQTIEPFAVDEWFMVPDKGTTADRPKQVDSIEEALDRSKGTRVFLTVPSTHEGMDLLTFQHPKDAVYIFGNTPDGLARYMREQDLAVSIYTPVKGDMFGHVVLPVVLFSRLQQERAHDHN